MHTQTKPEDTHLPLNVAALVVAVGRRAQRRSGAVGAACNAAALCEVLFALRPPDLDLLLLAAAAELVGLEGALGLEGCAAVLGDVFVGHACGDGAGTLRGGAEEAWGGGGGPAVFVCRG